MLSNVRKLADVERVRSYSGHRAAVYRLAADGKTGFFSAGSEGVLVHWGLNQPEVGKAVLIANSPIFALKSKNETVYAGTFDGRILSNKGFVEQRPGAIFGLDLVENNLLSIGKEGDFSAYETAQTKLLTEHKLGRENLRCIKIHPTLPLVVVSGSDGIIRILESANMHEIEAYASHKSSVFSLEFSKEGKLLYSAGRDAHIKVFDFETMSLLHDIPAHFFSINDLKLIYNDKYLASASMDKTIRIWKTDDMRLIKVIDRARHDGHSSSVNALLWNKQNETLISAGDDKNIFEWKIEPYV